MSNQGIHQGCILSPCLFNLYAEYIMRNAGLDEAQAGIKIAGRNINNLRWHHHLLLLSDDINNLRCRWHHPYGRKQRTEEPLDKSVRGEWKSLLKSQHSKNWDHGIWSHHFLDNRWGNNGNNDFIFLGSRITADGDCSHKIKRHLLLGRKAMTNIAY